MKDIERRKEENKKYQSQINDIEQKIQQEVHTIKTAESTITYSSRKWAMVKLYLYSLRFIYLNQN